MILALLLQLIGLHHVLIPVTHIIEQPLVTDDQCVAFHDGAGPLSFFAVTHLVIAWPRVQKVLLVERGLILGLALLVATQFDLLNLVHLVASLHLVQVVLVERQEMHDLRGVHTFLFELGGPVSSQLLGYFDLLFEIVPRVRSLGRSAKAKAELGAKLLQLLPALIRYIQCLIRLVDNFLHIG